MNQIRLEELYDKVIIIYEVLNKNNNSMLGIEVLKSKDIN
jgi:hypothetical protein